MEKTVTTEASEPKIFPHRKKAKSILADVMRNQKIIAEHPECDCEEAWKPIEKALNEIYDRRRANA